MIFIIIMIVTTGYVLNAIMYSVLTRPEASENQDLRFWFMLLFIPWLLFTVFLLSMIPKIIKMLIDEGKRVFNRTMQK